MAKFHIAKNGKPAACHAEAKACPLGSDTPHGEFDSAEAATAWAEEVHARNAGGTFTKKKKAPKIYQIASTPLPELQPGEDIDDEDMGWLVKEMLTEDGYIEERFLDDNYGFPRVLGEIKFEENPDGTFKLTGPKDAIEEWANEDPNELEISRVKEMPKSEAPLLPQDPSSFKGTPFENVVGYELRKAYDGNNGRQNLYRSAPTYNISNAETVAPEVWRKLADEAEAEYLKVEEERRGYAEEMRKSDARFPSTPAGSREANLKARQLRALSINARNAAYIASEKKLSTGDVLKPGEILVDATFDKQGNLLGYGDSGRTDVDGQEVRFSKATSKRGNTVHGVVAVKGVIERGQVVASSKNIGDARVLASSTSVNMAAFNPSTAPVESWTVGDHTYHGTVHGQAYFNFKPFRDSGSDSFIPNH